MSSRNQETNYKACIEYLLYVSYTTRHQRDKRTKKLKLVFQECPPQLYIIPLQIIPWFSNSQQVNYVFVYTAGEGEVMDFWDLKNCLAVSTQAEDMPTQ